MMTFPYLLSVLTFILALVFVAQVLRERRPPGSTMAWLLVIVLLPYVGIPFYLLVGGRKVRSDAKKKGRLYSRIDYAQTPAEVSRVERILLSSGVPAKTEGNKVQLLKDGARTYHALIEAIQNAQTSIFITTFIFKNDSVGQSVAAALEKKAEQGVSVRILIDGFFMFPWGTRFLMKVRRAGGQVAIFNPFSHPFRGNSNLRNHRKIVIVDGKQALIGGTNIAKEYMGPDFTAQLWADLSMLIEGPAVSAINDIFRQDWNFATRSSLPAVLVQTANVGHAALQVVPSGPDVPGDPLYDSIISAIFASQERVWVATPYFIPDETLVRALELAAKRGVDLRIIVPRKSNHILADLCRRSYLRQIHDAGGKVFFYEPNMLHGKVTLIDHDCALIGSANMDMRSLLFNYEIGVFAYSPAVVEETSHWLSSLVAHSAIYSEKEPGTLMLDGIGRILGPLL